MTVRDLFKGLYRHCGCNCGELIPIINKIGKISKFKHGHNSKGINHNLWNNGKGITTQKYIWLKMPWHPNSNKDGRISEHIFIMSRILGRPFVKGELVHHIDGNKKNNTRSNLLITDRKTHPSYHKKDTSNRFCIDCKSNTTNKIWLIKNNCYQCNKCYMIDYHKRKKL